REIQLIDALAGRTLKHMAGAEQQATTGDIIVDEDTAVNLGGTVTIDEWRTDEALDRRFGVVAHLNQPATAVPWPPIAADQLSDEIARPWLLPPVYERLQSGQAGYLAELRPAAPLFLRFSGIDYDGDDQAGDKLDRYIRWVQSVLARYEGYILQLTIGDKGSYLYTAFGAPLAHVDDDARAVGAGLELSQPPEEFAFIDRVQIGISQGRMRAGAYGSDTRQTYGVLGEETNMAARLMGLAESGQVLVRRWVAETIARQYDMQNLGQMKVKGKEEPIQVFRVVARISPSLQRPTSLYTRPLVGRARELAFFQKWLDEATHHGQVVRLEGGTGVGKSHLSAEMAEMGRQAGFQLALGSCQSMSRGVAYAPWRQIVRSLLDLEEPPSTGTRADALAERRQVTRLQQTVGKLNPAWLLRLPLLGDLLDLPIPDNATTLALDPKLRQESLLALITEMMQRWAATRPLLVVIDDVHWMDEASLALTRSLARAITDVPLLLLLVHRPIQRQDETILPELTELAHHQHLLLEELDAEAIAQLVRQQLEGPVQATAVSLIQNKAQGNPFFAEELLDNLQESGALQFSETEGWGLSPETFNALREADCLVRENGEWVVSEQAVLSAVDLGVPDSIYGTVLSRIDRLPEGHKLTLKVASVIGRLFAVRLVHEAHPVQPELPVLNEQTTEMMSRDFIRLERSAPEGEEIFAVYLFKHNTTQEVAYDTLLFAQRQQLHQAIGATIERLDDTAVVEIAYHAYRGEDWARALVYQLKAGQHDQQLFANAEAIDHYRKALKSADHLPPAETSAERLLAHSALGELLVTAGHYDEARTHLDAALALARELDDYEQQARLCRWLGRMYELRGEYMPALEWLQNGLYVLEDAELETAEAAELLLVAGL
ncbi:MAG: AAA family ATPase, partial [Anaerolineales bacterium]|nr:AAA family ATPase [Anaerolineales bacterium]